MCNTFGITISDLKENVNGAEKRHRCPHSNMRSMWTGSYAAMFYNSWRWRQPNTPIFVLWHIVAGSGEAKRTLWSGFLRVRSCMRWATCMGLRYCTLPHLSPGEAYVMTLSRFWRQVRWLKYSLTPILRNDEEIHIHTPAATTRRHLWSMTTKGEGIGRRPPGPACDKQYQLCHLFRAR